MSTVFDITGPLPSGVTVLEASAGTGKTFAITVLVTRFIVEEGRTADEVLMVTFARGAAAEIRERTRARLRDAINALESEETPKDDWLKNIVTKDLAIRQLRLDRARAAVANLDSAAITTIHGFCHQALRRLGTYAGDAGLADEVNAGNPVLMSRVLRDRLVAELVSDGSALGDVNPTKLEEDIKTIVKELFNNATVKSAPLPAGKDEKGEPNKNLVLSRRLARLADEIRDRVVEVRRNSKSLTFDDMVNILKDVIEVPATGDAISAQLRRQYKLVLIDEFQDTDMSQWKIFSKIFTPNPEEKESVLVMVGDPKQAIYRFRGADIDAYLSAVNAPGVTRHDMNVNWRSDADLIAALNVLMAEADFGQGRIKYVNVAPRPKAAGRSLTVAGKSPAPLEIRWLPRDATGGAVADVARASMAVDLANYIHSLIGKADLIDKDGVARKVRAKDIAILVRANKDSKNFIDVIRGIGVPVVESRVGGVNNSEAFSQVESLMNVLTRMNDARLVRSLAFTWFSELELKDLADSSRIEALQMKCAKWADDLGQKGVAYMFEQLRAESVLMQQIAGTPTPHRHLTDIEHVFELLNSYTEGRPVSPAVALHHLMAIKAEDDKSETLLRRTETDADAVTVTSMHSSKGLEYPIVLLPIPKAPDPGPPYVYSFGGGRFVDSASGMQWVDDTHGDQKTRKDRAAKEEAEDLRRLIYVALTRPRNQLTIWWFSSQGAHKGALGSVLFPEGSKVSGKFLDDDKVREELNTLVKAGDNNIAVHEIDFDQDLVQPNEVVVSASAKTRAADIQHVTPKDYEWGRWSFSSLTKDQHAAREESPEGGTDEEYGEPEKVTSPVGALGSFAGSAEFGTYLHKVMEHVDFAAADPIAEVNRVVDAIGVPEFVGGGRASFVQGIVDAMHTPLQGLGDKPLTSITRADRLAELRFDMSLGLSNRASLAELARLAASDPDSPFADYFAHQGANWGSRDAAGFLTGSIDALFRLDVDGGQRFVIVDYKSNNLGRFNVAHPYAFDSMRAEMIASGYPLQALIYSVATHRYLTARLPGYDPSVHLGGCGYLFMRGMMGATTSSRNGVTDGVFVWKPSADLVVAADRLLGGRND